MNELWFHVAKIAVFCLLTVMLFWMILRIGRR